MIEQERTKHPPTNFAKAEVRLLNEWTLQFYFEYLGHNVLYRLTLDGPEVLAVGFEEVYNRTYAMNPDKMKGTKTYLPYYVPSGFE